MMIGLFVVGGAIMQTGLAKLTGNKLMALSRGNETVTFLLVMLVTSFIGAFVSNTGTVALMMPIIMSLAAGSGMQSSRFLMPLAFAGSLGGMLTLIGTPPNLVIDEVLTEAGFKPLAFFSFFPVGIIVIAIGIIVLMPLSKIFLSKKQNGRKKSNRKSLDDLVDEYQLLDNLHRYPQGPQHSEEIWREYPRDKKREEIAPGTREGRQPEHGEEQQHHRRARHLIYNG